jgi:oxygen-dependent protoporphyrinogen oxidase
VTVAIVGGGIAGLTAAWHLQRAGLAPTVLEEAAQPGGLVRTIELDGRLMEIGADTLVTQKPAAVALCRRIGLGGDLVFHDAGATGTRVLRAGRPLPIPAGPQLFSPTLRLGRLLGLSGLLRVALEPRVPAVRDPEHDESLASFTRRRFGREMLDALVEPVLASLFLADAERLSVRLAMPRLLEAERVHGSVRRALAASVRPNRPHTGSGGFATLKGGLGTLPQRLAGLLPAGALRLGTRVARVERGGAGGFVVHLAGGESLTADAVVLACPAPHAGAAVRAMDPVLAARLDDLETVSCATVHLVYRREGSGARLRGHGFFVPRSAGLPLLACSYVSEKYPERARPGDLVLRAFVGGARDPRALEGDDAALLERTHAALSRVLGLRGQPVLTHVQRHPAAMPHFRVGDAARLARLASRAAVAGPLVLAGGLRGAIGVPDVVASAQAAADDVLRALGQRVPEPVREAAGA